MFKEKLLIICITLFSIICGLLFDDLVLGGTILLTGLLCGIYAAKGNKINYILGLINYILIGYVSLKNNLYGLFMFYIFLFAPLQIKGYIDWSRNLNKEKKLIIRQFTFKVSMLVTFFCIITSTIIGYLLTLIPNQQIAFLDASSNCVNLCGVILLILRFKEAWWLWLVNNIIDFLIWSLIFLNGGSNSTMMLLVSIGYLIINICGIFIWNNSNKKNTM